VPAQVAGASLLTDYVLTVAVSASAGTAALVSAIDGLAPLKVPIALSFVALIAFGNLKGVRESGKIFAVPTYFFMVTMGLLLGVGLWKYLAGDLPVVGHPVEGNVEWGDPGGGVLMGATLFAVLHAFASGGAAVTGVEAISNGVPAFRKPEWRNARQTLVLMGTGLGVMFLGLSALTAKIKVAPFEAGTPTVISQVGEAVFGDSPLGHLLYYSLQAGTVLILILAANTGFADFPRLASFQAGDSFLPRQMTKRGHRLVYSNGILVLAGVAMLLVIVTGAEVTHLIPLYAIGVFTGFTLSQSGMTKHHLRKREPGWRKGMVINGFGAFLSAVVTVVIAVTKFADGAWAILVTLPVLVVVLLRLNREYAAEAVQLEEDVPAAVVAPILRRHVVLVFVDSLDMATARAIQYARTLTPDELRAVHFALDDIHSRELAEQWRRLGLSRVSLDIVDCPDRRLTRCALETVARDLADGQTEVSVLLPDRKYRGLWHRLLHDRTSEAIERDVSMLPHANVTTVPFHFDTRRPTGRTDAARAAREAASVIRGGNGRRPPEGNGSVASPAVRREGVTPIAEVRFRQRVTVEGRVRSVRVQPLAAAPSIEVVLVDDTGALSAVFFGRRAIPGVTAGTRMRVEGMAGESRGRLALLNPTYELLANDR
jgi:amino acid transporter